EKACFAEAVELLAGRLKVDRKAMFMGGFSQGGYATTVLGEQLLSRLAGLVILGAGRVHVDQVPPPRKAIRGKQGLLAVGDLGGGEPGGEGGGTLQTIAKSFPLFPLCMIGGLIVQVIEDRFDKHNLIDPGLTRRIQNTALDFLVVAAIALIRVDKLAEGLPPFLIIVAAAIVWNVFCVVVLARRMLPDAWFERSIAEMGQSMGVTATGLLLLRVVDPDYESPAVDAFASKQLLHEPFMGGGLWTSMAIPLLVTIGPGWVLLIAAGAVAFWIVLTFATGLNRLKA
ncbi:hypothetical protein LCGC14_2389180, partial [marine sediment metagenome]